MERTLPKAIAFLLVFTLTCHIGYTQAPGIEWQKSLGGSADDLEKNVQQTKDGGYIIGGWTSSNDGNVKGNHGKIDYWIVKLDNDRNIEWRKCLGGSEDDEGEGNVGGMVVQQTTDSGYIIAANTKSSDGNVTSNHGSFDYWIVKLNKNGAIEWQKTLGGTGYEKATSIQQTSEGGYIVAGTSSSNDGDVSGNHGYHDYWIVKLNKRGNIVWQKSLGGTGDDDAYSIKQTMDNNYIVTGFSDSKNGDVTNPLGDWDYWVVKLSSSGNIIWQKNYGGSGEDYATDIIESAQGGYVVTGYVGSDDGDITTHHGGEYDSWIIKISEQGTIEWQRSFGGSNIDAVTSIQQTSDGGYITAQATYSNDFDVSGNHGDIDSWIVKLDADGAIEWQKTLGGSGEDYATSIQQTKDGGYLVGNVSASNNGDLNGNKGEHDYWIVKLKPDPVPNDSTWFTVNDKSLNEGNSGQRTMAFTVALNKTSGKPIKINYSTKNISALSGSDYDSIAGTLTFPPGTKTNKISVSILGDRLKEKDETFKLVFSKPVNVIIKDKQAIGTIINDDSTSQLTQMVVRPGIDNNQVVNISPNPAGSFVNIHYEGYAGNVVIQLRDLTGKLIKQQKIQASPANHMSQINVADVASGNYLVAVIDDQNNVRTENLVIQH